MAQSVMHATSATVLEDEKFLYGVIAEFDDAHKIVEAARRTRAAGYRKVDAYSPLPVEGLDEAIGFRDTHVPHIMLVAGILGGLTGFFGLYYLLVYEYPMNIGGRPEFAWPMYLPITFELTVLFAALFGIGGMIALNGLPQPYHPVFEAPNFDRASSDRFFLCIEAKDPAFDREKTRVFMEGLGALNVSEIELRK
ncbi:MAG: DUF3341 domain-containing protein [Actinomycetota bacterium]